MVTAKEDITNKILGLELGADDYITKPFDMREAYIEGDQDSLTIILINLLDNAIKYNRANGSISVKTYVASDGTNQLAKVCIEVSDKLIL